MDPSAFPDIGQPDSYTSSLLPGSDEQSSPVSDFTSEMEPFLTLLPDDAPEAPQSVQDANSFREASPVDPLQPSLQDSREVLRQSSSLPYSSIGSKPGPNPNTYTGLVSTNPAFPHKQDDSHQMWSSPPIENLDPYCFDDSPTCGSGTSNTSNLSPVSPIGTGTWSSPATSFQPSNEQSLFDTWAKAHYSTPTSDVFPGTTSETAPRCVDFADSIDLSGGEWHCEPLTTSTGLPPSDLRGQIAPTCPASPASMTKIPAVYMVRPKAETAAPTSFELNMMDTKTSKSPAAAPPSSTTAANDAPGTATASSGNGEHTPYAQLIHRALSSAPDYSMSLQDLYTWFQQHTQKCKPGEKGWMNSIRHNLSMNAVSKSPFFSRWYHVPLFLLPFFDV